MWWLLGGERQMPGVSNNVYYATGMGGHYVIVDRDKDLVIVIRWVNPSKALELISMLENANR